jgi:hypothetical protein
LFVVVVEGSFSHSKYASTDQRLGLSAMWSAQEDSSSIKQQQAAAASSKQQQAAASSVREGC